MELTTALSILSTTALFFGVVFAAIQVRDAQRQRTRDTALQFIQTYLNADFNEGLWTVLGLAEGLSRKQVEEQVGDRKDDFLFYLASCESLGILVQRGYLSLDLVRDLVPLQVSWRKLSGYVMETRNESRMSTLYERFQWLAEQKQ